MEKTEELVVELEPCLFENNRISENDNEESSTDSVVNGLTSDNSRDDAYGDHNLSLEGESSSLAALASRLTNLTEERSTKRAKHDFSKLSALGSEEFSPSVLASFWLHYFSAQSEVISRQFAYEENQLQSMPSFQQENTSPLLKITEALMQQQLVLAAASAAVAAAISSSSSSSSSEDHVISCNYCSDKFSKRASYREHLKSHTGKGLLRCKQCDYSTTRRDSFKLHMSSRHTGLGMIQCELCSYATARKSDFKRHMARHSASAAKELALSSSTAMAFAAKESSSYLSPLNSYVMSSCSLVCQFCGRMCYDYQDFQQHLISHIALSSSLSMISENISRSSNESVSTSLRATGSTVSKERSSCSSRRSSNNSTSFQCDVCGYTTIWKQSYTEHIAKHTGENMYECPHCSYSSTRKRSLVRHLSTHPGDTLLQCTQCTFSTLVRSEYDRHVTKQHQHDTFHCCPYCGHTTSSSKHFRQHLAHHARSQYESLNV